MIALDTNILNRILIKAHSHQTALTERLLQEAADAGYTFERVLARKPGFTRLV